MNNGHRVVREDTYEEDEMNLEDYVSNMNDIRWRIQRLYIHWVFMKYFDEDNCLQL